MSLNLFKIMSLDQGIHIMAAMLGVKTTGQLDCAKHLG
jgi:hypothetical protein